MMIPRLSFKPSRTKSEKKTARAHDPCCDAEPLCLPAISLPSFSLKFPSIDLPKAGCGCDIPVPCWWPQCAGEVTSFVCAGGTATLRVRVRNVGPNPHAYAFKLDPALPGAKITPDDVDLNPQVAKTIIFSVPVPAEAPDHLHIETNAWVDGCKTHFIRWNIVVVSHVFDSCHEIEIDDRPEYEHHWYDHFYCEHCCLPKRN